MPASLTAAAAGSHRPLFQQRGLGLPRVRGDSPAAPSRQAGAPCAQLIVGEHGAAQFHLIPAATLVEGAYQAFEEHGASSPQVAATFAVPLKVFRRPPRDPLGTARLRPRC